jgi:hypothetical protein
MDTEYRSRLVAHLLALKDAPDDVLPDQVETIGERAVRHMLSDEASWLQNPNLPAATDCAGLADRIDALVRPA